MALAGSTDQEAWFDSAAALESDCDEDFQSVPDGIISGNVKHPWDFILLLTNQFCVELITVCFSIFQMCYL